MITLTIDEHGDVLFLVNKYTASFITEDAVVRRASHVEPDNAVLRSVFHILRRVFGDKDRMSEVTRRWNCLWRVNTSPVGGPILAGRWRDRQAAIDAEIEFLNEWFVRREHGTQGT